MNAENIWKDKIKPYVAILAAFALWVVSVIFFIVGFSFGTQLNLFGKNIAIVVAFVISCVNTFIQITWNDEREDVVEWAMWLGSYVVGIASNIYGLMAILNMTDPMLERALSIGLGAMIEIAPEKLLLRGLKQIRFKSPKFKFGQNQKPNNQNKPAFPSTPKSGYTPQYRPHLGPVQNQGKPTPAASTRPLYNEPAYHPSGKSE